MAKGSIRRVDGHMRIATQLIDAESGRLVWAERFDRSEEDLPSAQDDIVRAIVGIMAGRIQVMETERAREKPPTALAASDLTLAGNALSWDDPVSACAAKRSFERAIEMDPGFARPYSLLAVMIGREWRNDPASSRGPLDLALNLAERAVELAGDESTCCTSLGYICLERHEFDLALHHMKRGVELNPVNPWNQVDLGYLLSYIGRAEEAQKTLEKARRLDPYIGAPWYWRSLGVANFVLREYRDALAAFERAGARSPLYAVAMMAACCRKVGLADRARALLAGQSETTIVDVLAKIPFKNASDATHLDECLGLTGTAGSR
jgi:tetratricopeptide (TPR) repeat protein